VGESHALSEHPAPAPQPEQPAPAAPPQPQTAIQSGAPAPAPSAPQRGAILRGSKQRGKHTQRQLSKVAAPTPGAGGPSLSRHAPLTLPPRPFEMTTWRRLRWVGLAAVPSSLMLGITTYMSTDISAIPLFWVIPLTL